MKYLKVKWIHKFIDEPELLYSELDEKRFETRKVEIFSDGHYGYADRFESYGSTMLGIEPIPPISEIAKDPQFMPEEISKIQFERVWKERK